MTQRLRQAVSELGTHTPDVSDFQVYLPENARGDSQEFRWSSGHVWKMWAAAHHPDPSRLYLCRATDKAARGYWLARLHATPEAQGPEFVRAIDVSRPEVRRLQYGFDLRVGRPVAVHLADRGGGYAELTYRNPLPLEERRLVDALAVQASPEGEWPVRYRFRLVWSDAIRYTIRQIGISTD
jgi:hypothetical protein